VCISTAMVSGIKAKMGLSKKRLRRKVARATSANGSVGLSVNDLLRAKKLVDQIGAEQARERLRRWRSWSRTGLESAESTDESFHLVAT